jgi:hypothetical protein
MTWGLSDTPEFLNHLVGVIDVANDYRFQMPDFSNGLG